MAIDRTTRETKTRANTTRRKPWQPPAKLDAPPAPDGFEHRWIRTQLRGEDDKANVFSRMREGDGNQLGQTNTAQKLQNIQL